MTEALALETAPRVVDVRSDGAPDGLSNHAVWQDGMAKHWDDMSSGYYLIHSSYGCAPYTRQNLKF